MFLNITDILAAFDRGEKIKYIFFWSDKTKINTSTGSTCLSQWYNSPFEVGGILYKTAEHWMMAEKARLFGDKIIFEKILIAGSPALAKKFGREIANYDEEIWVKNRFDIVVNGNYHKFVQNEKLKEYLINTKNRVLVEASPVDRIWGIGLAADHEKIKNPHQWKGLNLLGFALMRAREMLSK